MAPRKIATLLTAAALALTAAVPAQALGKNERNILKGIAAAVIVQQVIQHANRAEAQDSYLPPPNYAPHPAPRQSYHAPRPQGTPGRLIGQPGQHSPQAQRSAAEQVFRDYGPQGRRAIQQRLASYGYYRGAVDGVWGRGTASAVALYARDIRGAELMHSQRGALQVYQGLLG